MMAELILGVVSLGVAVPGVAAVFADCGKYIWNRISAFKRAPGTLDELKKFGYDLHSGHLAESIKLAEWAFSQNEVDPSLKSMLENQLERLRLGLLEADKALDKMYEKDGSVKRLSFIFNGERAIKKSLDNLSKWQALFWASIAMVETRTRLVPDALLLSSSTFKTYTQQDGQYCAQLKPGSHVWLSRGEISHGGAPPRMVSVIIERKREDTIGVVEVKEIASCLSRQLNQSSPSRGILKCLGYREIPGLELVFECPENASKPQTLGSLISNDVDRGYAGGRPLEHRFRIARQIAEAVLSVHTCSRVHKNIRPDTILIFNGAPTSNAATTNSGRSDDAGIGTPYLTDWIMLRKMTAPSTMAGENDWLKDIYRHPRRQGLQPEQRYNMGHDIYSLGVCLLEIGLWEPLIVKRDNDQKMCDKYRNVALKLGLVKPEDADKTKVLTKPNILQQVMVGLAEAELPQRLGTAFSKLVVSCLTCLEGGFGDSEGFEQNKIAEGVSFNAKVLEPLTAISF
jgi:serine/threonine protein kinase